MRVTTMKSVRAERLGCAVDVQDENGRGLVNGAQVSEGENVMMLLNPAPALDLSGDDLAKAQRSGNLLDHVAVPRPHKGKR